MESIYSKRIRAGKRRTYFFDVKATRANDYYLTITESRKRFNDNGYDRHKIFLYKEDFNKFIKALGEAIDYVKTELMPDFNFDAYNHDEVPAEQDGAEVVSAETGIEVSPAPAENNAPSSQEEVDKW
jgi:predicted AlkP superfamily phosphohydrolase/phosphomutase